VKWESYETVANGPSKGNGSEQQCACDVNSTWYLTENKEWFVGDMTRKKDVPPDGNSKRAEGNHSDQKDQTKSVPIEVLGTAS
jgi:hypothetical protein